MKLSKFTQYIIIFIIMLGLNYIGLSIYSSSWNPMLWTKETKDICFLAGACCFIWPIFIREFIND